MGYSEIMTKGPRTSNIAKDDCWGIHFIISGTAGIVLNGERSRVKAGDILLLNRESSLDITVSAGTTLLRIVMVLYNNAITSQLCSRSSLSGVNLVHSDQNDILFEWLDGIRKNLERQDFFCMSRISSFIYSILLELHRRNANSSGQMSFDKLYDMIRRRPFENYPIADMCRRLGCGRNTLFRIFKEKTGCPPGEFIIRKRMVYAEYFLEKGTFSIVEVAAKCGYKNPSYFISEFKKRYGMTPVKFGHFSASYKKKQQVRYREIETTRSKSSSPDSFDGGSKLWPESIFSYKTKNVHSLSVRRRTILQLLRNRPRATQQELAKVFGINLSAVQKHIHFLKENGYIRRCGWSRGGYWEII